MNDIRIAALSLLPGLEKAAQQTIDQLNEACKSLGLRSKYVMTTNGELAATEKKRSSMSPTGRARIATAMKARWARSRQQNAVAEAEPESRQQNATEEQVREFAAAHGGVVDRDAFHEVHPDAHLRILGTMAARGRAKRLRNGTYRIK